ncbi:MULTISPECIES: PfkB family carbohydrate kinase [unclassified Streptomyces]|uniref:PfkB family carbohydrate kinase n=1 Tax=unclassified Streptomyces TaxID=2593676 RepID=UPI000939DC44|nr:PfkB family carbohydrate kinase [Streptomyces sp. CB02058]OKI92469.1 sugar kinase [Streptomyces sp. CB02058]
MTGGRPRPVLVLGEALIDLVPVDGDGGVRTAQFGGAPANVAVGLARLGIPTVFAGGIGGDGFARTIEERLREAGADLTLCARSGLPTALAVAEPGAGGTGYHFHLQDTATFRLPDLSAQTSRFGAVYVGGLAAVVDPAAAVVRATAEAAASRSLLVVDPNVRRDRTLGEDDGSAVLRALCGLAHVVKASDEDLERLWPGDRPEDTCRRLAACGRLVVLTRGARGSTAYTATAPPVSVDAVPVEVVNTIGAGDAFAAGLLSRMSALGSLTASPDPGTLRDMLSFASRAAASVCARAGTEPSVPAGT